MCMEILSFVLGSGKLVICSVCEASLVFPLLAPLQGGLVCKPQILGLQPDKSFLNADVLTWWGRTVGVAYVSQTSPLVCLELLLSPA